MKKTGALQLAIVFVAILATILVDRLYLTGVKSRFNALVKESIVTSNQLATAKIVYENLNHVRDLVFENMDFPAQKDSTGPETICFNFLTECINDLKMKIIAVRPLVPVARGCITIRGYDLELEGDFFKFGELCAKFENSRRLISIESFMVEQSEDFDASLGSATSQSSAAPAGGNKSLKISMRIHTYRIRKGAGA